KMTPPPSRSAASMGLFSEIRLKFNRVNIAPYQGNVDQITGQIGTLPPISALSSLFGRTQISRVAQPDHGGRPAAFGFALRSHVTRLRRRRRGETWLHSRL